MGLIERTKSRIREAAKNGNKLAQLVAHEGPRSPHWPTVEKRWRRTHPLCAACGGIERMNVHHKKPFHLFPELELEETNLISLCMMPGRECHYFIGHGKNWKNYNPGVEEDAAEARANPASLAGIISKAEAASLTVNRQ